MKRIMTMLLGVGFASTLVAGEQEVKAAINMALPQYQVASVEEHTGSGLYLVQLQDGPELHVSADGKFFIVGDRYRIDGTQVVNETEQAKLAQVESYPEDKMIIYKAAQEKAHISVFTDIDCGYCRMLHKEVDALNDMGITVRYLAYPRAGVGSPVYKDMVSIWCSDDPNAWLTKAKQGQNVPSVQCDNPVAEQFQLGNKVGVRGTPSIILDNGKFIPGYLPADELAKELGIN